MICPHCNQKHPDEFQFCPNTGKKIELMKACNNPNCPDNGKFILPPDSRFCPTCGALLDSRIIEEEQYEFNPKKRMSSVDDFRHGNIIIDGVILGKTPASELERFKDEYCDDAFLMVGSVLADGGITPEKMIRILEISKQYDPQLISAMKDRVYRFIVYVYKNIRFLTEIGFDNRDDDDNIVKLFESNGYVRIEPPVISEVWKEKLSDGLDIEGLYFISNKPNAYGNHILISQETLKPLNICVSWLREWTTYYDGVKHSI